MTPVRQTVFGPAGNCWAACLASLLECGLSEIPPESDRWTADLRAWLATRGKRLGFLQGEAPPGWSIGSQRMIDGTIHAVVCRDGEIIHDPSPRPMARPGWPFLLWSIIGDPPIQQG